MSVVYRFAIRCAGVFWLLPGAPTAHHDDNVYRKLMTKVGRKPRQVLRPTLLCLVYPLRGCFLSAAFRATAGYFLLLRQKKVPKEKATRRRKNSRENRRHPGAAHPLRLKEGGLFPGWRQFSRLAPTGSGASGWFWLTTLLARLS
ncbi:hypothetical protein PQU96_11180 [Vogesella sp. LYT5W]|uniref:Secreted protein n=1 Tax=Vogesella margarita TaxID=2984199 RepID=A0ABT5IQ79_9NEIS|nr:hypothetical protein [Vogesella margarita]MDC7714677.1 hypothetical protein [Vogesella margarita]